MPDTTVIYSLTSSKMSTPVGSSNAWWLAPTPLILGVSILLALAVPLLLHLFMYRSSSSSTLPTFVLAGPSGAGKTALQTLIERIPAAAAQTVTSQAPLTVEASVPVTYSIASNRYRSANDPSVRTHKKFLLTDTPGHGKLRHHALDILRSGATKTSSGTNICGLIFVLDATSLGAESPSLRDAADYLHDVLLSLQTALGASSKVSRDFPVLLLVNKLDLFTAVPPEMARRVLEDEISKVRVSRSKGLMAAGAKEGDLDSGDESWLGQGGEAPFGFGQMEDSGIFVTLQGSSIGGDENVQAVWTWMGEQL